MSKLILNGAIVDIFPSEIIGTGFEKRVFHLQQTDVEKHPQTWALECHQGDANMLDKFKAGDIVSCHIEIRGKVWSKNGRTSVFNTLKCTKIDRIGQAKAPAQETKKTVIPAYKPDEEDLPF